MNNCPKCGSIVNQGEPFCRVCGTQISSPNNFFNNSEQNQVNNNQTQQTNVANINYQQQVSMQNNSYEQSQQMNTQNSIYPQQNQTSNNSFQQVNMENINNMQQNQTQQMNSQVYNNQDWQFNSNYNNIVQNNDDDLIDAYIGKNADKIKNSKFSVLTFFFYSIYLLYRKMWLLGFIVIAINIVSMIFLKSVSSIVIFATKMVMAFNFSKWYLNNVREQVQKIKSGNSGKTRDELIAICKKKGGTTIIPVIIYIVIELIVIIISVFSILMTIYNNNEAANKQQDKYDNILKDEDNDYINDSNTSNNANNKIGNLSVYVPNYLNKSDMSIEGYLHFRSSYDDYDNDCDLTITQSRSYSDSKKYLEEEIYYRPADTFSGIKKKKINGNNWYYAKVTEDSDHQSNYYSISKDNAVYYLEFNISADENKKCSSAYNEVISSLKFN